MSCFPTQVRLRIVLDTDEDLHPTPLHATLRTPSLTFQVHIRLVGSALMGCLAEARADATLDGRMPLLRVQLHVGIPGRLPGGPGAMPSAGTPHCSTCRGAHKAGNRIVTHSAEVEFVLLRADVHCCSWHAALWPWSHLPAAGNPRYSTCRAQRR